MHEQLLLSANPISFTFRHMRKILNFSTPPGVDGLIRVADNSQGSAGFCHQADDVVLNAVRVLELIYKNMLYIADCRENVT